MKRWLVGSLMALILVFGVALTEPTPVLAHHATCVSGPYIHRDNTPIDFAQLRVYCGRGWVQIYAWCYWPEWQIDNGVVVSMKKHYAPNVLKGRPRHKEREAIEDEQYARVWCNANYPIMDGGPILEPFGLFWH